MEQPPKTHKPFVSRAGQKLDHALTGFALDVAGLTCADLGCNAGGFTDVLLRRGAKKVYAVDTGYGMLDYSIRRDARVVVMERTNAMHVRLPEPMDLVVIDVAWTRQQHILPAAYRMLSSGGRIVSLVKPHYESADAGDLVDGVLRSDRLEAVLTSVDRQIESLNLKITGRVTSPIVGQKGNVEVLYLIEPGT